MVNKIKERINPIEESIKSTGNFSVEGEKVKEKIIKVDKNKK